MVTILAQYERGRNICNVVFIIHIYIYVFGSPVSCQFFVEHNSFFTDHETIFDDDLIRLKKLLDRLHVDIMSAFCTKVGLSDHLRGGKPQSPSDQQLWQWRNINLTSKPKEVFSEITDLMGDKTYGETSTFIYIKIYLTFLGVPRLSV